MRVRHFAALSGALLAASAMSLPAATAGQAGTASTTMPLTPCQSNINPADDTGQSLPAQQYPASSSSMSTKGAVLVRLSASCALNYVTAYGKLVGPGPVLKVNLAIRADNITPSGAHHPGVTLASYSNNAATGTVSGPYYIVNTTLPSTFSMAAATFYWVQMQVKMNPSSGTWYWEVVQPDPATESDVWRNPGNGFLCGGGWKPVSLACMGGAPGKGLMTEVGT